MATGVEGLIQLGQRPTLRSYVREVWARRDFAIHVPLHDIRVQNIDTVLGQFWQILNPAMMVLIYYLIFGLLLEINRGIDNYPAFLVIGILLYNLVNRVVMDATRVIDRDRGLIRSLQFPRALLPLSVVMVHLLAFFPSLAILAITMIATGEYPTWRWLAFPAIFAAFVLVMAGLAAAFARLGEAFRDLNQIMQHVFRILFYVSGCLFAADGFVDDTSLLWLFSLNPIYDAIALSRWSLMSYPAATSDLIGMIVWTLVMPVVGLVYFARAEHTYGR